MSPTDRSVLGGMLNPQRAHQDVQTRDAEHWPVRKKKAQAATKMFYLWMALVSFVPQLNRTTNQQVQRRPSSCTAHAFFSAIRAGNDVGSEV